MDPRELSDSFANPQLEPADHVYVVLADHGPSGGGWGPTSLQLPWTTGPVFFTYTGTDENVLAHVAQACQVHAQQTGMPTKLVRYSGIEDVFSVGGSS